MKLGQTHLLKYRRCKSYSKVISNIRYVKCYKCYNEARYKENQEHLIRNIDEYFSHNNVKESVINNAGYVDPIKYENNIRLFCVNPRGFSPDTYEKIMMLKQSKQ